MDECVKYGLLLYDVFYPERITYMHPTTGKPVSITDYQDRKRYRDDVTGCAYIEVRDND